MLGPRKLALTRGEFVVSFLLPPRPPRSSDAYLRFIPRTEMDIAVVGAGVSLSDRRRRHDHRARACRWGRWRRACCWCARPRRRSSAAASSKQAQDRLEAAARAACAPIDDKRGTDGIPHPGRGRADAPGGPDRAGPSEDELMAKHHVEATVNGDAVEFLCETEETLLDVLRDTLHLTGSKEGCASGDCGACSVTLDGRLVCSCLVLGCEVGGRRIETIEGMAQGEIAASAAAEVPGARRAAVRDLHARLPRRLARPCSRRIQTRPRRRSATGWPATCAGARDTTRS